MIRAAGALLWRQSSPDSIEIGLVHRSRYNDWTIPKGKIEDGESAIACAYREIFEETGIKAEFTRHLATVEYTDNGIQKRVKYWVAESVGHSTFIPNEEVSELVWNKPNDAIELATYQTDKDLIKKFLEIGGSTDTLIILRHAKALDRGDWDDQDSLRVLSEKGFLQAEQLVNHLEPFKIEEIYSSDFTRCVQTVTQLAQARGITIVESTQINEEIFEEDPEKSITFTNALKQDQKDILICSHNPVIPTILRGILNSKLRNNEIIKLEPGDAWLVHRIKGEVVALDYLPIGN